MLLGDMLQSCAHSLRVVHAALQGIKEKNKKKKTDL